MVLRFKTYQRYILLNVISLKITNFVAEKQESLCPE